MTEQYNKIFNDAELPRVLIIGQTFTTDTGGGITLSNLFKGWPKNKLAVAVESKENVDFERCTNYYRIGFTELKLPFPFSVFQRKTRSGPISADTAIGALHVNETKPAKAFIKNYFDDFLHHTGLYFWVYGNQKTSEQLLAWIKEFDPQVIYFQPNSYKSLDFICEIKEKFDVPMIVHVMDDWFSFIVRDSPLKNFWQRVLDKKIKNVFAKSTLHLSICKFMADEYQQRYGYQFYPFHNCVDVSFWQAGQQADKQVNNPALILYAGRIGYGVEDTLLKVAMLIEKMGNSNMAVRLEIQTKDQNHELIKVFNALKHVSVSGPVSYKKLPAKFSEADILLIPCDFDGAGARFIKYSMPTKVSEYMATGTPVLVIGPPETALVEYAKEGWARVCTSADETEVEAAVEELINSETLRGNIRGIANQLVYSNHEENHVINQFREKVIGLTTLSETVKDEIYE